MATGGERTYGGLILSVLVCVASVATGTRHPKIEAVYINTNNDGEVVVAGEKTQLEIWGSGFSKGLEFALTSVDGVRGGPCWNLITPPIIPNTLTHAHATFTLLPTHTDKIPVYTHTEMWVCVRDRPHLKGGRSRHMGGWMHLGTLSSLTLVPSALQRSSSHRLSNSVGVALFSVCVVFLPA
ncbi:hypothetical protein SK128_004330 [Halocaridina rubra]|uniref:Uncharacterized protein n=1 Tax=Halocaridina rubra TaxID=373956 RepID=A0AAN8XNP0_HALRR